MRVHREVRSLGKVIPSTSTMEKLPPERPSDENRKTLEYESSEELERENTFITVDDVFEERQVVDSQESMRAELEKYLQRMKESSVDFGDDFEAKVTEQEASWRQQVLLDCESQPLIEDIEMNLKIEKGKKIIEKLELRLEELEDQERKSKSKHEKRHKTPSRKKKPQILECQQIVSKNEESFISRNIDAVATKTNLLPDEESRINYLLQDIQEENPAPFSLTSDSLLVLTDECNAPPPTPAKSKRLFSKVDKSRLKAIDNELVSIESDFNTQTDYHL